MFGEAAQQHSKLGELLFGLATPLADEEASSAPVRSAALVLLHFHHQARNARQRDPGFHPKIDSTRGRLVSRHGNVLLL